MSNSYNKSNDELISAYMDNELSGPEEERAESLLRDEPRMRQLFDDYATLRSGLKGLPEQRLDDEFASRVLNRLGGASQSPIPPVASAPIATTNISRSFRRYAAALAWVTVASIVLVLCLPGVLHQRQTARHDHDDTLVSEPASLAAGTPNESVNKNLARKTEANLNYRKELTIRNESLSERFSRPRSKEATSFARSDAADTYQANQNAADAPSTLPGDGDGFGGDSNVVEESLPMSKSYNRQLSVEPMKRRDSDVDMVFSLSSSDINDLVRRVRRAASRRGLTLDSSVRSETVDSLNSRWGRFGDNLAVDPETHVDSKSQSFLVEADGDQIRDLLDELRQYEKARFEGLSTELKQALPKKLGDASDEMLGSDTAERHLGVTDLVESRGFDRKASVNLGRRLRARNLRRLLSDDADSRGSSQEQRTGVTAEKDLQQESEMDSANDSQANDSQAPKTVREPSLIPERVKDDKRKTVRLLLLLNQDDSAETKGK